MTDTNQQTPATVNQISNEKPNIERTFTKMSGTLGGSFNGGHYHTIAWFRVMAGTQIENYQIPIQLKMLTPLCPPYGAGLTGEAKFYFVPDSRVFKNSEEYYAQNGGSSKAKITKKPSILNQKMPFVQLQNQQDTRVCLTETTQWRDSWISSYLPRIGYADTYNEREHAWITTGASMPDYDACILRGRIAIWNDFERNKQYDGKQIEYSGDTVTTQEWNSYLSLTPDQLAKNSMRCRRNNSYFMDYRIDAQGYETDPYDALQSGDQRNMMDWANLEAELDELRQQTSNAEANPWTLIKSLYGTSRELSEGKVQLLKTYRFPINYAHVTQNTYNTNESVISEQYKVLGEQGAYSFTDVVLQGMRYWEAIEPGYIHVIVTVTAETVFERAFERTAMNVTWDSEYRPSLKDQKLDTLNYLEVESHIGANGIVGGGVGPIGFKRKWNEMGKLPNICGGDMSTWGYWQSIPVNGEPGMQASETMIISQGSHQFYEENAIGYSSLYSSDEMPLFNKQYYMDYTDLLINKNQAIMNAVVDMGTDLNHEIMIEGQNQIFYGGKHILTASLPIDGDIITNFTKWGEH